MQLALRYFSAFVLLALFQLPAIQAQGNFDFTTACFHDETVSEKFTGATELSTCSGDGTTDRIQFTVSNLFMAFGYVVVDEQDIIVSIGFSNFIDFEMLPAGTLRVYAFSTFGLITANVGDNFTTTDLSVPCFDLTDNFVTVNNSSPGAVSISTPSGETEFNTCPGDGIADEINFLSDGTLANNAFIITDADGVILDINTSGTVDFDGAGTGICRVYAVSYSGDLMIEAGDNLDDAPMFDDCGGISDNFITVNRQEVVGGTVATVDGDTEVMTCPGDGVDDIIAFTSTGSTGSNFTYVVTDENNIILGVPPGNEANFEGAGEGACRLWGLSYEGNLLAGEGDNAAEVMLADGCFALSENFVNVIREAAEGGTIATDLGATEVATCPGDGNDDVISFEGTGAGGGQYALVVTDENNVIIGLPPGNEVNFEDAGEGICRVWGLSYQGDLLAMLGDNAAEATLATSCADLSDNFVTVVRTVPSAGTVATEDGETEITTCPGDDQADIITFVSTGSEGSNFTFVVTDADNIILGVPEGNIVDFEGAGLGACRLWGLTYEGNLLAMEGDDAAATQLADGCFALSDNFVTVNRIEPEGGTVATVDGETEVTICVGDGVPNILEFISMGASGPSFDFIVTDADGFILGTPAGNMIDFEDAGLGGCRLYGVSYSNDIIAGIGVNIEDTQLADGCFDLSSNFVTVNRIQPEGGTVSIQDGTTSINTCPGDGNPDIVQFDSTGTSLSEFTYLITDDQDVVLGVLNESDQFNFDFVGTGVCHLWGLGYEGILLAGPGDTLGLDQLASECSALSENFVTVIRETPAGGTVSTEAGETEVFVCPGDMISDVIAFDSMGGAGGNFTYLVTDINNIVLAVPSGDMIDFDAAGFGTCRLWGLTYQGELQAEEGDDATAGGLASGCYSLSDNFVTVVREDIRGGTVATITGDDEVFTCPGDGIDDLITVISTDASEGDFIYVITDDQNVILGTSEDNIINLEGAGEGVCRIWGLAYAGELLAMEGDDAAATALASGCFSLSDNFITVVRTEPVGGQIATLTGATQMEVCSGDGSDATVGWEVMGGSDGGYTYLIAQNGILLTNFDETSFDFSNAASGTYQVYGLAYAGTLSLVPGLDVNEDDLASSCFDLSSNFIEVQVTEVDACSITAAGFDTGDLVYLCASNPNDGLVEFLSCSPVADTNYQYVITTADDVIIFLIEGASFDFGALPLPSARVYAISYSGDLNPNLIGSSIDADDLADGCFTVTDNFITIINGQPEAGEISLSPDTPEPFCVANGNGNVMIQTTSMASVGYGAIVTDADGIVLQVSLDGSADFNDLPSGDYLIYGVSYTGSLTVVAGDDIELAVIADNCFELSEPLDFFRADNIDGGIVSTQMGTDTFYACPGDGMPDLLAVSSTISGVPYRYLVTDELGNIIIPNAFSNIFDFEDAEPGNCRVYGYAFSGTITASFGQNVETAMLSDSCYALSENYITIIRQPADGGTVATVDGDTTVTIDLDTDMTTVSVVSTDAADQIGFTYLVTDEQNFILDSGDGPTFDFADAPAGVCRIWGLSYQGELVFDIGDSAEFSELATSCVDLSDNFVEVTRINGFQGESTNDALLGAGEVVMTAFPNPVSGDQLQVILESDEVMTDGQAFILDQNGRAWASQFVAGGTSRNVINFDISQCPTGLFVVQYRAGDQQQVIRFLRQ